MDKINRKYEIFISSTYEDLKEERNVVTESLLDMGCCFPAGMERFPASSLSQWEYIKKIIDDCDYYLLIVAGRYGTLATNEKISYTEKEYNYAESRNIPILTFVYDNINNLPAKFVDKQRSRINTFRKRVSAGRLVKYYSSTDDLRSKVKDTLYSAIQITPRPGWIRADKLNDNQVGETSSQNQTMTREEFENMFNLELSKHIATDKEVIDALWGNSDQLKQALSENAKKLLIEAAKDTNGQILISVTLDGTHIFTNGKLMNEEGTGKCVAIWEDAIMELVNQKLAKASNSHSSMYSLTKQGYELAEKMVKLP